MVITDSGEYVGGGQLSRPAIGTQSLVLRTCSCLFEATVCLCLVSRLQ